MHTTPPPHVVMAGSRVPEADRQLCTTHTTKPPHGRDQGRGWERAENWGDDRSSNTDRALITIFLLREISQQSMALTTIYLVEQTEFDMSYNG